MIERLINPRSDEDTHKTLPQLSRGTAEQLYLALRFGYIRDYATSSVPVSIIFDDILVNFDPARMKHASEAIADLAETCQVLYFTCHLSPVTCHLSPGDGAGSEGGCAGGGGDGVGEVG